jgi:hypothetical protein
LAPSQEILKINIMDSVVLEELEGVSREKIMG